LLIGRLLIGRLLIGQLLIGQLLIGQLLIVNCGEFSTAAVENSPQSAPARRTRRLGGLV